MLPFRSLSVALACTLLAGPANAVDRLDPRDFDTKIAACMDLYQFANGGWLKATPVAPGSERNNRFIALEQHVQEQRRALAKAIRTHPSDPLDTALAALMQSVLDETALNQSFGFPLMFRNGTNSASDHAIVGVAQKLPDCGFRLWLLQAAQVMDGLGANFQVWILKLRDHGLWGGLSS